MTSYFDDSVGALIKTFEDGMVIYVCFKIIAITLNDNLYSNFKLFGEKVSNEEVAC